MFILYMFITQNNCCLLFALLNDLVRRAVRGQRGTGTGLLDDFEVATQCNMAALTSYATRTQKSLCTHSLSGGRMLIFNAIFR